VSARRVGAAVAIVEAGRADIGDVSVKIEIRSDRYSLIIIKIIIIERIH